MDAPHLKPAEARATPEIVSQPYPLAEPADAYKTQFNVTQKRDIGLTITSGYSRDERFQYQYEVGYQKTLVQFIFFDSSHNNKL